MKSNPFGRRDEDRGRYSDNRSERDNRHQAQEGNRYDDYRIAGGAGNRSRGHNEGRNNEHRDWDRRADDRSYSTSRNYGNMGSYGGAQGFGSSRGGHGSQRHSDSDTHFNSDSGHRAPQGPDRGYSPDGYRAYNDRYDNRQQRSSGYRGASGSNDDLYGSDVSRRFQGRGQDHYDFDMGRYGSNSSSNYSGGMHSDHNRQPSRGDYGSSDGNYGSLGYRGREDQSERGNRQGSQRNQHAGQNSRGHDDNHDYQASRDSEFVDRGRKNFFKY